MDVGQMIQNQWLKTYLLAHTSAGRKAWAIVTGSCAQSLTFRVSSQVLGGKSKFVHAVGRPAPCSRGTVIAVFLLAPDRDLLSVIRSQLPPPAMWPLRLRVHNGDLPRVDGLFRF